MAGKLECLSKYLNDERVGQTSEVTPMKKKDGRMFCLTNEPYNKPDALVHVPDTKTGQKRNQAPRGYPDGTDPKRQPSSRPFKVWTGFVFASLQRRAIGVCVTVLQTLRVRYSILLQSWDCFFVDAIGITIGFISKFALGVQKGVSARQPMCFFITKLKQF